MLMNKGILILFLIFGVILIIIELTRVDRQCPKQKIIYRYIPRTFDEEQDEPVYVTDIFKTMFTQPTAWVRGVNDYDFRKKEEVNKFYVSQ